MIHQPNTLPSDYRNAPSRQRRLFIFGNFSHGKHTYTICGGMKTLRYFVE